jgi:hypothetical protein
MKFLKGLDLYRPQLLLGASVKFILIDRPAIQLKVMSYSMTAHTDRNAEIIYKGFDTEGMNKAIHVEEIDYAVITN